MSTKKRVTVLEPISSQVIYDNTTEAPKLKVAAYARVSTEQDEQQSSYEAQVNYYNQYIRNNPAWEFVGIYADEGITGTNTKKRDGFNRMIADAKAGKIDLILTKSISRFARNTVDALQTIRELSALKIEVYFEKEGIHTLDKQCEVMLTIMSRSLRRKAVLFRRTCAGENRKVCRTAMCRSDTVISSATAKVKMGVLKLYQKKRQLFGIFTECFLME